MDLRKYIGHAYQERGCWELLRLIYRDEMAVVLPDYAEEYARIAEQDRGSLGALILGCSKAWRSIDRGDEQQGDAVLFRMFGQPSHIGVVSGAGEFIHVQQERTAVIESYRGPRWLPRLEGFYRLCN